MPKRKTPFRVTRRGEPIQSVSLKDAVNPAISYSQSFAEWEAATAAGLDLWRWEQQYYPKWFKARVIAWHRLHGLVEAHTQDAVRVAEERKTRMRRHRK